MKTNIINLLNNIKVAKNTSHLYVQDYLTPEAVFDHVIRLVEEEITDEDKQGFIHWTATNGNDEQHINNLEMDLPKKEPPQFFYDYLEDQSMWEVSVNYDRSSSPSIGWISGKVGESGTKNYFDVTYEQRDGTTHLGSKPSLKQAKKLIENHWLELNSL